MAKELIVDVIQRVANVADCLPEHGILKILTGRDSRMSMLAVPASNEEAWLVLNAGQLLNQYRQSD